MSVEAPLIRDILNGTLNSRIEGSQYGSPFDNTKLTQAEYDYYLSTGTFPVTNYSWEPGNVLRYGARNDVNTGVPATLIDSSPAVQIAHDINKRIFFPPGTYYMLSTIIISGEVKIITGEYGGTLSALASRIVYDGAGPVFSSTGTEFGGIYIGHLEISGGDGSGAYGVLSTRPQSVFERLFFSLWNNGGIRISASAKGSFGSRIRACKVEFDVTIPNAFTGYDISLDGGDFELRDSSCIGGNIGADLHQSQDWRIIGCDFNRQNSLCSTQSAANGQAAIRTTGTISGANNYKPVGLISKNYLEACTTGWYGESGEGVAFRGNFVNDVAAALDPAGPVTYGVYLKTGDVQNVIIEDNQFLLQFIGATGVYNNSSNKVRVLNNSFDITSGKWLDSVMRTDYGYNTILNGTLNDPSKLTYNIEPANGTFTPTIGGSTTAGTQGYDVQIGYWERFGRRIRYDIFFQLNAKDAATAGNLTIFGLPFTTRTNATSGRIYSAAVGEYTNILFSAATKTQLAATASDNSTSIVLFECGSNIAAAALTAAALQATTRIRLSISVDT